MGPMPRWMLQRGRNAHRYYLPDGRIYEKSAQVPHVVAKCTFVHLIGGGNAH